ncbi:aquaporin-3-like [Orbicella faveolata]|uniref:aquaporin-3-like n=1 Tax=Orbicella faveolata TaxID=48498 RepID=UPI0009E57E06|nr:aquaporin-3-like [Orbicella faveolata]
MANRLRGRLPPLLRETLAEFMSTFILVTFGVASVAQTVLSRGKNGTFFTINFSWGIGVTLGIYWAGGISGAHMNPAVTLAFAVVRRLDWIKVPVYWLAQLLGAFIASAAVYCIYHDSAHWVGAIFQDLVSVIVDLNALILGSNNETFCF